MTAPENLSVEVPEAENLLDQPLAGFVAEKGK
jgi:hypothetical protein